MCSKKAYSEKGFPVWEEVPCLQELLLLMFESGISVVIPFMLILQKTAKAGFSLPGDCELKFFIFFRHHAKAHGKRRSPNFPMQATVDFLLKISSGYL